MSSSMLTYIGGPTALLEHGGLRFLTDPTFDAPGEAYTTGPVTLHKITGPAKSAESLGAIDIVLLSHDHHFDNLDHAGRRLLSTATKVLTTPAGAERLGGNAIGLANWQRIDLATKDGRILSVTGTPARHGPPDGDRGPVTGFVLAFQDAPQDAIYISGDTVWYEGVAEVSQRFSIRTAVLFMGAARVRQVGPAHLTMTAEDAIEAARAFADAQIIPLHFEDWQHFSESRNDIDSTFRRYGLSERLRWPEKGKTLQMQ
jgi:L-ascorbate metabolism protein UlaG (beta-lactamase superfamily)